MTAVNVIMAGQLDVVRFAGLALAEALSRGAAGAVPAWGAVVAGAVGALVCALVGCSGVGVGGAPGVGGGGAATSMTVNGAVPTAETLPARSVARNASAWSPTPGTVIVRATVTSSEAFAQSPPSSWYCT